MSKKFQALNANNTQEMVSCPNVATLVGNKWLYCIKPLVDDKLDKYKARVVAKGYNQIEGVDCVETFSLVVEPQTINVVLTLAMSTNQPLKQLNVTISFLYGDLQETTYMCQPKGFEDKEHPTWVLNSIRFQSLESQVEFLLGLFRIQQLHVRQFHVFIALCSKDNHNSYLR